MKSVLYIGGFLMAAASIYGFVDYKQTRNRKEFKEMYVEEKKEINPVQPSKIVESKEEKIVKTETNTITEEKTTDKNNPAKKSRVKKAKKKRFDAELFSRAPLREPKEYTEQEITEKKKD